MNVFSSVPTHHPFRLVSDNVNLRWRLLETLASSGRLRLACKCRGFPRAWMYFPVPMCGKLLLSCYPQRGCPGVTDSCWEDWSLAPGLYSLTLIIGFASYNARWLKEPDELHPSQSEYANRSLGHDPYLESHTHTC